jgi:hypothetical protein
MNVTIAAFSAEDRICGDSPPLHDVHSRDHFYVGNI